VSENESPASPGRKARQTVLGTVVSDKMQKTIVVERERRVKHPLYKKYMRRTTRLVAHDAEDTARVGDEVELAQTRPLSKSKRWRLVRIVRRAPTGLKAAPAAAPAAAKTESES
jgi:small subunit ribosomal protein S17